MRGKKGKTEVHTEFQVFSLAGDGWWHSLCRRRNRFKEKENRIVSRDILCLKHL